MSEPEQLRLVAALTEVFDAAELVDVAEDFRAGEGAAPLHPEWPAERRLAYYGARWRLADALDRVRAVLGEGETPTAPAAAPAWPSWAAPGSWRGRCAP